MTSLPLPSSTVLHTYLYSRNWWSTEGKKPSQYVPWTHCKFQVSNKHDPPHKLTFSFSNITVSPLLSLLKALLSLPPCSFHWSQLSLNWETHKHDNYSISPHTDSTTSPVSLSTYPAKPSHPSRTQALLLPQADLPECCRPPSGFPKDLSHAITPFLPCVNHFSKQTSLTNHLLCPPDPFPILGSHVSNTSEATLRQQHSPTWLWEEKYISETVSWPVSRTLEKATRQLWPYPTSPWTPGRESWPVDLAKVQVPNSLSLKSL